MSWDLKKGHEGKDVLHRFGKDEEGHPSKGTCEEKKSGLSYLLTIKRHMGRIKLHGFR